MTIDEIMNQSGDFARASIAAAEAPIGQRRSTDAHHDEERAKLYSMIAAAIAEARREGAEAMRGRCEELVRPVAWLSRDEVRIGDGHELADAIRTLPLPTGPRQAVRLTNQQIMSAMGNPEIEDARPGANRAIATGRSIETAVLAANGMWTK